MNERWTKPEVLPRLQVDEVQVWRVDLSVDGQPASHTSELLERAQTLLNAKELERATRMRAGRPREEFIAARGCLRYLLGGAMRCDPRLIAFDCGVHGKPEVLATSKLCLAPGPGLGAAPPAFNVAHSHGMILIALSHRAAVGVDVEFMDASVEAVDVARAAFHPSDLNRIESARSEPERLDAFYRCWTLKEAVAKADGRGLTLPAVDFSSASFDAREQRVELAADINGNVPVFHVKGIEAGPAWRAALACAQPALRTRLFDLDSVSLAV